MKIKKNEIGHRKFIIVEKYKDLAKQCPYAWELWSNTHENLDYIENGMKQRNYGSVEIVLCKEKYHCVTYKCYDYQENGFRELVWIIYDPELESLDKIHYMVVEIFNNFKKFGNSSNHDYCPEIEKDQIHEGFTRPKIAKYFYAGFGFLLIIGIVFTIVVNCNKTEKDKIVETQVD